MVFTLVIKLILNQKFELISKYQPAISAMETEQVTHKPRLSKQKSIDLIHRREVNLRKDPTPVPQQGGARDEFHENSDESPPISSTICKQGKLITLSFLFGEFNININRFLTFLNHPPTPSKCLQQIERGGLLYIHKHLTDHLPTSTCLRKYLMPPQWYPLHPSFLLEVRK